MIKRLLPTLMWMSLLASTAAQASDPPSLRKGLVVVELFQSQGCSSCPPAEANLNALAGEQGVLALSFDVTYWDDEQWKDTFADPAYTQRQWDYAHHHGRDTVWTPQVYVNGQTDLLGTDRVQLDKAIASARQNGPAISWKGRQLVVHAVPDQAVHDVWLVRYDPRTLQVAIAGGENSGRTLPQRNVVRELVHLGNWNGNEQTYAMPPSSSLRLFTAALVQARDGGSILAAAAEQAAQ